MTSNYEPRHVVFNNVLLLSRDIQRIFFIKGILRYRERANMLQNTSKTLGFQKIMVFKTPPGGGEPYLALCLIAAGCIAFVQIPQMADVTSVGSYQAARVRRLIRAYASHKCHFVTNYTAKI